MYICLLLTFFIVVVANNYKVISEPGHLCYRCTSQANLGLLMGLGLLLGVICCLTLPNLRSKSTERNFK